MTDRAKGWTKGVPLRYLKGHNIGAYPGDKHPNWKGGRRLSSHGYIVVLTDRGRVYEHILVAESAIGRRLRYFSAGDGRNEVVHHVNGEKTNNANDNLLICTHAYHVALHARLENSPKWPQFSANPRNRRG